ncbi:MAG: hypothetical protein AAB400_03555 [Patescibacteria group bacterium]
MDINNTPDYPDYISQSVALKESFRVSGAAALAAAIMKNRSIYEDRRIPSASRDVYRIGSFMADGIEHHAILKLERGIADMSHIAFEAHFFYQCSARRPNVDIPSFVLLPRVGLIQGIIMEDLSQGGYYTIEELYHAQRNDHPFLQDQLFRQAVFMFEHEILNIPLIVLNDQIFDYFLSGVGMDSLRMTTFVVYNAKEFKRLVVADIDQLYGILKKMVDASRISELEQLIVDIGQT